MKRALIIILSIVAISGGLIVCSSRQSIEDISQSSLSSSQKESSETQSAEPEENSGAIEASEPEYRDEIEIPAPLFSAAEISSAPNQAAVVEPNQPQNTDANGEQPIAP